MVGEFIASLVNRPRRADPARVLEQLTPREREIAIRAAQGYTNKQIADDLVISPETVKSHMRSILIKLGLHSKTELRVYWRERDIPEFAEQTQVVRDFRIPTAKAKVFREIVAGHVTDPMTTNDIEIDPALGEIVQSI
jgi:DNA-binding CsgD family transcriptional regulator